MTTNHNMKTIITALALATTPVICHASASDTPTAEADSSLTPHLNMDNGVVPIADNRGFTLQSNDGSFVFKPYLYMQSTLNFKYYDDVYS